MALAVLFVLFLGAIARHWYSRQIFGPIMILWFVVSALGGLSQNYPSTRSITSTTTHHSHEFFLNHPLPSFPAMGAVNSPSQEPEALYADMVLWQKAIRLGWLLLHIPHSRSPIWVKTHPRFYLQRILPHVPQMPYIYQLSCLPQSPLIASQAVIAGAFSIIWRATRLNFLPRIQIVHTSRNEYGQVYIPLLNWLMFSIVVAIILGFGSSKPAAMFGSG